MSSPQGALPSRSGAAVGEAGRVGLPRLFDDDRAEFSPWKPQTPLCKSRAANHFSSLHLLTLGSGRGLFVQTHRSRGRLRSCCAAGRTSRPPCARQAVAARLEAPEVEAPVHLLPRQAQQGAQEDRAPSQIAAAQVRDGLEGVGATHLQARAPPGSHDLLPCTSAACGRPLVSGKHASQKTVEAIRAEPYCFGSDIILPTSLPGLAARLPVFELGK